VKAAKEMGGEVAERRLRLVLAAAAEPVAIDALAESGLWSVGTLWDLVERARRDGLVVAADASGPARLRWAEEAGRGPAIVGATPDDLAAVVERPPLAAIVLSGARAARRERDFPRTVALYRGLAATPDPAALPGGEATWLEVVLELIRVQRSASTIAPATLDAAVAMAEMRGDLGAQAVLLAARGLQWLSTDPVRAQALFGRAAEAAEAHGDPGIRTEVRTYIAVSLVFAGRLRDGIAAFEEMLGDVPGDVFDRAAGVQLDLGGATPASALVVLAFAYVSAGDHPRAIDLLDRMAARGRESGNAALEAQGRLFLALTRFMAGEPGAAREDAEKAYAYWVPGTEPMYAWFASLVLAAARAAEGALPEARRLLDDSLPSWNASGKPWVGGSRTLDLLAQLEGAGLPPLAGLDVDGEIARHVDAPYPASAGVALRYRSRRLLGGDAPDPARAAADLERALPLLRAAETTPELRLALADAAALAEARGDAEAAARLRAELAEKTRAAPGEEGLDVLRLAAAILDLGRLAALPRREGLWGEVAARLCRELGAERSAIVEEREGGPVLIAARGSPPWQEAVLARLRAAPPREPTFEPALPQPGLAAGTGRLAVVPFSDEELGRRGFVVLENRDLPARLGAEDARVLRVLGRQVGILLANVAAWRELVDARQRLEQENRYYREVAPAAPGGTGRIVSGSRAMGEVLGLAARVAQTTTPVLVTGETGVGKELVSREVHQRSSRRAGPFIAVHVAALAPGLVASALFGHERGAFTGATEQAKGRFELADGGTIFLDEVGELSLDDQVRLLRVLEEGTFERVGGTRVIRSDFRLVAATNRDLAAEVRAGRFREDLYYRLAAFPIRVPALRERPEDIPTLALYFLERAARKIGVEFDGISEGDVERLLDYPWPGNVRELEHLMERAVLLSQPPRLRVPALESDARPPVAPRPASQQGPEEWVTLEEAERRHVREVLRHAGGRVNGAGGAAEILGLKPSTLQFWIDKLGLRDELARAREARRGGSARRRAPGSV
jgi:transcriptional regulator with GAF, ATPase, and Fis domain